MMYWRQVAAAKRKPSTHKPVLAVDDFLSLPAEDDANVPPLYMHSGYSRFVFSLIQKGTAKTEVVKANLPARDVGYVFEKTKIALQFSSVGKSASQVQPTPDGGTANSLAYTQALVDKKYAGKTPAAILSANPGEKSNLLATKEWLKKNLEKYPGNKKQIDAIDEAIQLLEFGELVSDEQPQAVADSESYVIYDEACKYMSDTNDKGHRLCYDIAIYYNKGKDFPFTVCIKNYYAPVIKAPDGSAYIKKEQSEQPIVNKIVMSEQEWYSIIESCFYRRCEFEMINAATQRKIMEANSYQFKK